MVHHKIRLHFPEIKFRFRLAFDPKTLKLRKRWCFGLDDLIELFPRLWLDTEEPRLCS
ncbi:MAG: hypothetical protein WAT67_07900 [Candidatus Contendobacter sp.]